MSRRQSATGVHAWINFIDGFATEAAFTSPPLQSDEGQELLKLLELPAQDFETFVLLERGRVFTKSTAALRITRCNRLACWPLLSLFCLIPRPLRDVMYQLCGAPPLPTYGKAPSCRVPTAERTQPILSDAVGGERRR